MLKLVIFDHSGVLIDDLAASWEAISKIVSTGGCRPDTLKSFRINFKLPHTAYLIEKGFTKQQASNTGVVRAYSRYYFALAHKVGLFADVEDTLISLLEKKVELAIVSSSPREVVSMTVEKFGLGRYFKSNCVFTREDYRREKPSPDPIDFALTKLQYDPSQVAYVGDMREDVEAARKARVWSVALYRGDRGYHILTHLQNERPSFLIEDLKELIQIVDSC